MSAIEPNVSSLLWFALLWSVCCLGFLVLAGMFPLGSRPDGATSPLATALVLGNALLWMLLVLGTGAYGAGELRWTSLVVVGGLVFLFVPGLLELLPGPWRDGAPGLAGLFVLLVGALALLNAVGAQALGPLVS